MDRGLGYLVLAALTLGGSTLAANLVTASPEIPMSIVVLAVVSVLLTWGFSQTGFLPGSKIVQLTVINLIVGAIAVLIAHQTGMKLLGLPGLTITFVATVIMAALALLADSLFEAPPQPNNSSR